MWLTTAYTRPPRPTATAIGLRPGGADQPGDFPRLVPRPFATRGEPVDPPLPPARDQDIAAVVLGEPRIVIDRQPDGDLASHPGQGGEVFGTVVHPAARPVVEATGDDEKEPARDVAAVLLVVVVRRHQVERRVPVEPVVIPRARRHQLEIRAVARVEAEEPADARDVPLRGAPGGLDPGPEPVVGPPEVSERPGRVPHRDVELAVGADLEVVQGLVERPPLGPGEPPDDRPGGDRASLRDRPRQDQDRVMLGDVEVFPPRCKPHEPVVALLPVDRRQRQAGLDVPRLDDEDPLTPPEEEPPGRVDHHLRQALAGEGRQDPDRRPRVEQAIPRIPLLRGGRGGSDGPEESDDGEGEPRGVEGREGFA